MRGRAKGFALLALVTPLVVAADAHGTVTIGSNLGREPLLSSICVPSCTEVQDTLSPALSVAAGVTSPVNGTVVTWRVRTGTNDSSPSALRVVSVGSDQTAVASATSPTVTPPLEATATYAVQLPIEIGDRIGIDCCLNGIGSKIFVNEPGQATLVDYIPKLVDGAPPQSQFGAVDPHEVAINADIEPTSAFAVKQVKSGKGGKVTVVATYPNPGSLAAGEEKQRLLKSVSRVVQVPNQTISILLKPTKRARALLHEKRKVKDKIKVVFTPTGGNPSTQTLKVKLKR
jgi:hypothetical protein